MLLFSSDIGVINGGAGPLVFKTGGAEYPSPPPPPPVFFTSIFHRLIVFYNECDYSFYRFIRKVLQKTNC